MHVLHADRLLAQRGSQWAVQDHLEVELFSRGVAPHAEPVGSGGV